MAAARGLTDCLSVILSHGADPSSTDGSGMDCRKSNRKHNVWGSLEPKCLKFMIIPNILTKVVFDHEALLKLNIL